MKVILLELTAKQSLEDATRPLGQEKQSYNRGLGEEY
jgi:hypothetical protein